MNREKVVKGLEHCRKTACESCPYNATDVKNSNPICLINEMLSDALALLKEQETANLYKCPNCGTWVSAENVVQFKDCKHYDKTDCSDVFGWCNRNGEGCGRTDDWFCADGERKSADEKLMEEMDADPLG